MIKHSLETRESVTSPAPGLHGGHQIWNLVGTDATAAGSIALDVIEFEPGTSHALHRHSGCEQVMYMLKGSGLVLHEGAESFRLSAGEALFIEANEWHGLLNDGSETLCFLSVYGGVGGLREGGYEEAD